MCLIIFPLGEGTKWLSRIFLFLKKFIEDIHGLLIRYNTFTVELVFFIFESDDIIYWSRCKRASFRNVILLNLIVLGHKILLLHHIIHLIVIVTTIEIETLVDDLIVCKLKVILS